jgi:hypothetical protein
VFERLLLLHSIARVRLHLFHRTFDDEDIMLPESLVSLILLATAAYAQNTATGTADVAAAAATAKTSSPTSNVKGKAFDRFVVVWLENTDYDKSIGDREPLHSNFLLFFKFTYHEPCHST